MPPIVANIVQSVCLCMRACLLVSTMIPTKMVEPVKVPFGVWSGLRWIQGTMYWIVGVSSNAAFCCQYYSHLVLLCGDWACLLSCCNIGLLGTVRMSRMWLGSRLRSHSKLWPPSLTRIGRSVIVVWMMLVKLPTREWAHVAYIFSL